MYSVLALFLAFLLTYGFHRQIFIFLAAPIKPHLPNGGKLIFLGITEPFFLYLKVALLAAVFLAAPFILYQAWRFIAPGLYLKERRWSLAFVISGTLLFLSGGAFAYYVAFPFGVEFLLGMGEEFEANITGPNYLSFLMTVILGMGFMFEIPLVIVFLSRMGLVTPGFLLKNSRFAIVIIFFVAALITPTPDVLNLCLFALPTLLLYFLGIGVAALFVPKEE